MAEQSPASSGGAKRPWQGTTLGVLDIIGTVFLFLGGIMFFFMKSFLTDFLGSGVLELEGLEGVEGVDVEAATEAVSGLAGMMGTLGVFVGVILLVLGVLGIFMARGAFKGQKWSPIVSIVFSVLGVVGMATSWNNSQIVSLVIDLLIIYLAVMCVKSPYFNRG